MIPKLRVARPTNNLAAVRHFYVKALGLSELYKFAGHDSFDGLMVGQPQAPYHLEFTQQAGHVVPPAPAAENLLVFYLPELTEWQAAVARMQGTATHRSRPTTPIGTARVSLLPTPMVIGWCYTRAPGIYKSLSVNCYDPHRPRPNPPHAIQPRRGLRLQNRP